MRLLLLGVFFSVAISGYTQSNQNQQIEIWGGVSVFQYFGDIGGSADEKNLFGLKDISLKSNRPGFNFGVNYWVSDKLLIQGSNLIGIVTQTDKGSRNSIRNFSFSTIADEISVQGSYFFIKENKNINYQNISLRGGKKNLKRIISVYGYAGAGALLFKVVPKDNLDGSPRFNGSKSVTLAIPVGLGVRLAYTQKMLFAFEFGARLIMTDYLDGFSSKDSKYNDTYYVMNFKAVYRISTKVQRNRINAGY